MLELLSRFGVLFFSSFGEKGDESDISHPPHKAAGCSSIAATRSVVSCGAEQLRQGDEGAI